VNAALEGHSTTLVERGRIDEEALKKETLTMEELYSVLNKNGFTDPAEVDICVLEPNGTFYVRGLRPSLEEVHSSHLMKAIEDLSAEVRSLRAEIAAKG
jgi:uncharacterized membrane protein YcaP (DUF421 family)